jgi:hypothetical protein
MGSYRFARHFRRSPPVGRKQGCRRISPGRVNRPSIAGASPASVPVPPPLSRHLPGTGDGVGCADKIDPGVGVYRDDHRNTPVLRAVKAAERMLLESQPTRAYVGPRRRSPDGGERRRIEQVRERLAVSRRSLGLARIDEQKGMFSLLPLTCGQIGALRRHHAIYVADNRRISLAGLTNANLGRSLEALEAVAGR